jgi:hypothetical protein
MRQIIGFLVVTAISTVAAAQSSDPLETCAQKSDAAARLACFDQEMQRRHATNVPREAPPPAAAAAATAAPGIAPSTTAPPAPAVPAAVAAAAAAPAAAGSATAASHADENVGLEGAQLRKKLREQGVVEESHKPNPIVAQVTRAVEHPDSRYTFVLDNGQVWEQVESKPGLFVNTHDTVTITPGVLGSFFLQTSKKLYFRVRRVQ